MPEFTSHPQGTPSWAELSTTDDQGALAFYGALFGWVDEPNEMGPGMYYHMQKLNSLEVAALYQQGDEEKAQGVPPHWKTYFTVDDIQRTTDQAKEFGATVIFGPMVPTPNWPWLRYDRASLMVIDEIACCVGSPKLILTSD